MKHLSNNNVAGANTTLWMFVYTLVFFALVLWLCFNPGKLVKKIENMNFGTYLITVFLPATSKTKEGELFELVNSS